MTRKQLPYFVAFLVLLFGAMACACLGSGTGLGGCQATANGASTEAAAGAATAGAVSGQGNSATATAVSGGNGGGEASATPGGAGATANGGPKDIPVVSGQINVLLANDQLVTYRTKLYPPAVETFYKDPMPKNEGTMDTNAC